MEVFRPYVSLFRDPGMDEATKDLVEKYYKNMEYGDALSLKLNELQNAPFSGDALINKNLKSTINTGLEGLANEGAYEHSEKELRKLGTTFNTLAPAISQNYAAYTKANQDLKERLEKKEINDEQYQLAKIYNTYGYEGLKLDPTGRVDQNTYFSPKTIYNDAKPIELLSARIKDLLPRTYNKETTRIGQNADGKWTATDGEKTMEFKDSDVTAIVNSIKNDPNVQGYISQLSDMRAVNALAADKVADFITEEIASSKQRLVELEAEKKSAKEDQIAQYDDAIKKVGEAMTKYQEVLNSGDKNKMAQTVRELSTQEEYAKIDAYGDTQRGLQTYETVTKRDNDNWKLKAKYEANLNMGLMTTSTGEVTAATDGTGKDYAEKKTTLEKLQLQSADYAAKANQPGLSEELKATYLNMKRSADLKMQQINNSMVEAANRAIYETDLRKQDPTLYDVFKTLMPDKTAGEIYIAMQRTFDNFGDQDYLNFKKTFDSKYGEGALKKHMTEYYGGAESDKEAIKRAYPNLTDEELDAYNLNQSTRFNNTYRKFEEKVNEKFKEVKIASEFSNQITMPTEEGTIQATNGMNEFFGIMGGKTGRPLRDTEMVIYNGENKFGKDNGIAGYNVVKWQWSPTADMFELQLKNSDGDTKTVYMSGDQVGQQQGKDKILGTPSQIFATEINTNSFGLDEGKKKRFNGLWEFNSKPIDYEVTDVGGVKRISFYYSGSTKPIGLENSSETSYTLKDDVVTRFLNTGKFVPSSTK